MPVIECKSKSQFDDLIKSNSKVAADFGATWCGPCRRLKPFFHELSEDKKYGDITFVSVDIDVNDDLAAEYKAEAVPMVVFIKNGGLLGSIVGFDPQGLKKGLASF